MIFLKRNVSFLLLFLLIFLTACGPKEQMILPMVEDVQQINIMRHKENWFYFISEDAEIENLLEDIRNILNQLSQKERDVLILRYGLDNNGVKKTLDEIGSQYGVSRERIRQIENRAISKLKKLCKNEKLHDGLINYFGS